MAAARPFGPDPTTTASNSIATFYTRDTPPLPQLLYLRTPASHDGLWRRAACSRSVPDRRIGHGPRSPSEAASKGCLNDCDRQVRPSAARRSHAAPGTDREGLEKSCFR